jgi:2'-5' RNA ligase
MKYLLQKREDMRLFTCVWVPGVLREKIKKFQQEMIKLPIKAKFVETNNLHLTVTFLGDVNEGKIDWLKSQLDLSVEDTKKFNLKLGGLKIIPNENYIKVMGIQVMSEEMPELIKKVAKYIGGDYHEATKLTLCRVKNVMDKKIIKEFIEKHRNVKIGGFEVRSVALVNSTLTRNGPIYETIHESSLE